MSYLTLKANSASTPSTFTPKWDSIGTGGMQYRAVGATEWTNATAGVAITVDTTGIELKADTIKTSNTNYFSMTGSISASGDITSLTNGVGGDCILNSACYSNMFQNCTALTAAPVLPATTLTDDCYYYMFDGCTSLTTPPVLPATTLAKQCYCNMFSHCTAITTAPALPATTLTEGCYWKMFSFCSSLTTATALPATTLAQQCYCGMFGGCTSLTTPPSVLPATTMAKSCYQAMFSWCTSLAVVPALLATTLDNSCYYYMFEGCTSLIGYITPEPGYTLIHNHPTTTSAFAWNESMYANINTASTVPGTPSSNINYYFKPVPQPSSVEGKRLDCIGHD